MNTYSVKNLIIASGIVFGGISLHAQQMSKQDSIRLSQVEVIKEFEVTLEEARKIAVNPEFIATERLNYPYSYQINASPVLMKYPAPEIRPLAMDTEPPFIVNRGYLSVGYGNLRNPSLAASYHFDRKELYNLLLGVNYDALNNEAAQPFQRYADLNIHASGNYLVQENMKAYGKINLGNQQRYFFQTHLPVDSLYTKEESLRNIRNLSLEAGVFNPERASDKMNYNIGMKVESAHFTDQNITSSSLELNFGLQKQRTAASQFGIDGKTGVRSLSNTPEGSLRYMHLIPYLGFHFNKWRLKLGGNFFFDQNTTSPWPELDLLASISGHQLQLFAGTTQSWISNDPVNQYRENPFLNVRLDSLTNNVYRDIYGGVKGELGFISYQAKAGFKWSKNQAFFLNDSTDYRKFIQLHDDMTIVYISGNIDFAVSQKLHVGGWLTQNFYNPKNLEKAWHMPNFNANAYATYSTLNNKFSIRSELFLMDQVNFINLERIRETSNLRFDLNAVVTFRPVKNVGIYFRGINLLNNKYERWYGYPNVGVHFNAGVQVVF